MAESFTDDTSLPHVGSKVSINAQVLRELPSDWFQVLLNRAPNFAGELKSALAAQVYFALPADDRTRVECTLRSVRIHIVDTRLYISAVDKFMADFAELRRATKDLTATALERLKREVVATEIVYDSPSRLFLMRYRETEILSGRRLDAPLSAEHLLGPNLEVASEDEPLPSPVDLTAFQRKNKNIINVTAAVISRSGSVFFDAIDALEGAVDRDISTTDLLNVLSASHAFDEGDARALKWIEHERSNAIEAIVKRGPRPVVQPLEEINSRGSPLVQAADCAAGVVREIWRRHGLPRVTRTFDYVTFNGQRINEDAAAKIQAELDRNP